MDEYVRFLDGQARFFNSQLTAHVGYLITTVVGFFAVFNLVNSWIIGVPHGRIFSFILLLFASFLFFLWGCFPYSPKYFLARLQYYTALSEVAWDHMPFSSQSPEDEFYAVLRRRAVTRLSANEGRLGLRSAITEFFEARLYVSLKTGDTEDYKLTSREQALFRLEEYYAAFGANLSSYAKQKVLLWDKTDLLLLAYAGSIRAE